MAKQYTTAKTLFGKNWRTNRAVRTAPPIFGAFEYGTDLGNTIGDTLKGKSSELDTTGFPTKKFEQKTGQSRDAFLKGMSSPIGGIEMQPNKSNYQGFPQDTYQEQPFQDTQFNTSYVPTSNYSYQTTQDNSMDYNGLMNRYAQVGELRSRVLAGLPVDDEAASRLLTGMSSMELSPEQQDAVRNEVANGFENTAAYLSSKINAQQSSSGTGSGVLGSLPNAYRDDIWRLSTQFKDEPVIKDYRKLAPAYTYIASIDPNNFNNTEAQAALVSFTKSLDPESVVREGELALTTQYASNPSLLNRLKRQYAKAVEGREISDEAMKQIIQAFQGRYTSVSKNAENIRNMYITNTSDLYGVDPQTGSKLYNDYAAVGYQDTSSIPQGYEESDIPGFLIGPDGSYYKQSELPKSSAGQTVSIAIPKQSRIAYVNNNPGNLKFVGQPGAQPGYKGFARFETPQDGYNALLRQVSIHQKRGDTLISMINRYAPPTENNTNQYIMQASRALGVDPRTPVAQIDPHKLAQFIALKESSTKVG